MYESGRAVYVHRLKVKICTDVMCRGQYNVEFAVFEVMPEGKEMRELLCASLLFS